MIEPDNEVDHKAMCEAEAEAEEKTILDLTYRASDDLLIAANALVEADELADRESVISFFEKPHKWETELTELGYGVKK